jgi:hypothetical protein
MDGMRHLLVPADIVGVEPGSIPLICMPLKISLKGQHIVSIDQQGMDLPKASALNLFHSLEKYAFVQSGLSRLGFGLLPPAGRLDQH